jgi:hypothetical protein
LLVLLPTLAFQRLEILPYTVRTLECRNRQFPFHHRMTEPTP